LGRYRYGLDDGGGYTDRAAQARATEEVDLPGGVDAGGRATTDDAMTRSEEATCSAMVVKRALQQRR